MIVGHVVERFDQHTMKDGPNLVAKFWQKQNVRT
jgi:hypothetical protein